MVTFVGPDSPRDAFAPPDMGLVSRNFAIDILQFRSLNIPVAFLTRPRRG